MPRQTKPNPAAPALQRKYSGLDNELHYLPGHTIDNEYNAYKAADKAAGVASKAYRTKADSLKLTKPYPPTQQPVGQYIYGNLYSREGHQTLMPIAGTAAEAAQNHYERRNSFNKNYEDVLKAQGEGKYENHVKAAKQAQSSQKKYAKFQAEHKKYGK